MEAQGAQNPPTPSVPAAASVPGAARTIYPSAPQAARPPVPPPQQPTTNNQQRTTGGSKIPPLPQAPGLATPPPRPVSPPIPPPANPPRPANLLSVSAPKPPQQPTTNNRQLTTDRPLPPTPPMPPTPSAKPAPAPLARVDEKLSGTSVSTVKPFDLSLRTESGKPKTENNQAPPAQPEPPKKNYAKDPYREPVE